PRSALPRRLPSFPTRRSSDLSRALAIACESIHRFSLGPPAVAREPDGRGEVVEGDDGNDIERAGCRDHAAVVVERRTREESFFRDRKSTRLNSSHRTISYVVF